MNRTELNRETITKQLSRLKTTLSAEEIVESQPFLRDRGYKMLEIKRVSDIGVLLNAYHPENKDVMIKLMKFKKRQTFEEYMAKDIKTLLIRSPYVVPNIDLLSDTKNMSYSLIIKHTPLTTLRAFLNELELAEIYQQDCHVVLLAAELLMGLNDIHNENQVVLQLDDTNVIVSRKMNTRILNIGQPMCQEQRIPADSIFLPKSASKSAFFTVENNYYSLGAIMCIMSYLDIQYDGDLCQGIKNGFFPLVPSDYPYKDIVDVAFEMMSDVPSNRINCVQALRMLLPICPPIIKDTVTQYLFKQEVNHGKLKSKKSLKISELNDGGVYEGKLIDNKREGKGVLIYSTGERYEGEFKNNLQHGQGTLFDLQGNVYIGNWVNGEKQGNGIIYFSDSNVYDGETKNGIRHGIGTQYYHNQERYEGEWKDDKRHGLGTLFISTTEMYEGYFKNDKFCGKGKYTFKDGSVYNGEWYSNKRHGFGTQLFTSGEKYIGYFDLNKKSGQGTYFYSCGSVYKGEWKDDQKNGKGLYTGANKESYDGFYVKGQRSGYGVFTYSTGKSYRGEWLNDQKHGHGTMYQDKSFVSEGVWINGVKQESSIVPKQKK